MNDSWTRILSPVTMEEEQLEVAKIKITSGIVNVIFSVICSKSVILIIAHDSRP